MSEIYLFLRVYLCEREREIFIAESFFLSEKERERESEIFILSERCFKRD